MVKEYESWQSVELPVGTWSDGETTEIEVPKIRGSQFKIHTCGLQFTNIYPTDYGLSMCVGCCTLIASVKEKKFD